MKKLRKRRHLKTKLIITAVFLVAISIYIDVCLRPVVITVAQYRVQGLISKAVNNAIISVMDETNYSYADLVEIVKNEKQEILSVNYKMIFCFYDFRDDTRVVPYAVYYITAFMTYRET